MRPTATRAASGRRSTIAVATSVRFVAWVAMVTMARSRVDWMDLRKVLTHRDTTTGSTLTSPMAITISSRVCAMVRDRLHHGNSASSPAIKVPAIASWSAMARPTTRSAHDRWSARWNHPGTYLRMT